MSSKTPNVDLYKADKVADADQTFNIDTMLNENWDKVDAAIGEMRTEIGEIEPEIPDASTTQKGIVQLDDTTNSTSKRKAATADAVRRVKEITDTKIAVDRPANLLPNSTGAYGLAGWRKVGGERGWYASVDAGINPAFFQFTEPSGANWRMLESDQIPAIENMEYTVGVNFNGATESNQMFLEVVDQSGTPINNIYATGKGGYHRKTLTIKTPLGTSGLRIRLGVAPNVAASFKAFSLVTIHYGSSPHPWNDDVDARIVQASVTKVRALELGMDVAGEGPAFIDFHSGAQQTDYDARIIAHNGNGTTGKGNLTYYAEGGHYFDAPLYVQGTDLKKSVSDLKISVRDAITAKGGKVADADGDGVSTGAELVAGINSLLGKGSVLGSHNFVISPAPNLQAKNPVLYGAGSWSNESSMSNTKNSFVDRVKNRIVVFGYRGWAIMEYSTGKLLYTGDTGNATRYAFYDAQTGYVYYDPTGMNSSPNRLNISNGEVNVGWRPPTEINSIGALVPDKMGGCYVLTASSLYKVNSFGTVVSNYGKAGATGYYFNTAVTHMDIQGNIYLVSYGTSSSGGVANQHYLLKLSPSLSKVYETAILNSSQFYINGNGWICSDNFGNVYIGSYMNNSPIAIKLNSSGDVIQTINDIHDMQRDSVGNLYVIRYATIPGTSPAVITSKYEKWNPTFSLNIWSFSDPINTHHGKGLFIDSNEIVPGSPDLIYVSLSFFSCYYASYAQAFFVN